jgi:hypothetical protein
MIASFLDKLLFWLLHTYSLDLFLLIFPIEQAPSLASRPDEFEEEESLVTPDALSARIGGFQIYAGSVNWGVFGSMKIVFLKSKLNVLIPCGFLAIFLNYMTQRYGWVFPLSMLGIIPLAERLGFATEQLALFTGPKGLAKFLFF